MEKISSKFIELFVSNNIIKNEDKEIYEYAFNIILSSLVHIATIVIIGLCFNLLAESLVFYFSFIAIRKFAGGYHAKTPVRCYVFSVISSALILTGIKAILAFDLLDLLFVKYALLFLGLICVVLICVLSPIDTANNPLNDREKRVYKVISVISSVTILLVSYVLTFCSLINISIALIFGIFMSALVLVPEKILKKHK